MRKPPRSPEEQAAHLAGVRAQVERLFTMFSTRHLRNPEKAMVEYVNILSGYRLDDLTRGVTRALQFERLLPSVAEVREHVGVAIREREDWEARRARRMEVAS